MQTSHVCITTHNTVAMSCDFWMGSCLYIDRRDYNTRDAFKSFLAKTHLANTDNCQDFVRRLQKFIDEKLEFAQTVTQRDPMSPSLRIKGQRFSLTPVEVKMMYDCKAGHAYYTGCWKSDYDFYIGHAVITTSVACPGRSSYAWPHGEGLGKLTSAESYAYELGNWVEGALDGYCYRYSLNKKRQISFYRGEFKAGLPHGFGVLTDHKSQGFRKSDEGIDIAQSTGSRGRSDPKNPSRLLYMYCGDFRKSEFHGKGEYTDWTYTYKGDWEKGKKQGNGCQKATLHMHMHMRSSRKLTYEYQGHWVKGKAHGDGSLKIEHHLRTAVVCGGFAHGMMEGQAIIRFAGGIVCRSVWKAGKTVSPSVTIKYEDDRHSEYVGPINGLRDCDFSSPPFARTGLGTFKSSEGWTYEGMWVNDVMHGHGKTIYADGTVYDGWMRNGHRHGDGVWFKGVFVYDGKWENDCRHGKITILRVPMSIASAKIEHSDMMEHVHEFPVVFEGFYRNDIKYGRGLRYNLGASEAGSSGGGSGQEQSKYNESDLKDKSVAHLRRMCEDEAAITMQDIVDVDLAQDEKQACLELLLKVRATVEYWFSKELYLNFDAWVFAAIRPSKRSMQKLSHWVVTGSVPSGKEFPGCADDENFVQFALNSFCPCLKFLKNVSETAWGAKSLPSLVTNIKNDINILDDVFQWSGATIIPKLVANFTIVRNMVRRNPIVYGYFQDKKFGKVLVHQGLLPYSKAISFQQSVRLLTESDTAIWAHHNAFDRSVDTTAAFVRLDVARMLKSPQCQDGLVVPNDLMICVGRHVSSELVSRMWGESWDTRQAKTAKERERKKRRLV